MVKKSKRAFRTISEAAGDLDVPQHVLRFWETKFSAIKPMKRGGNRRFYRRGDIHVLMAVKHHLYEKEETIKAVQQLIKENGAKAFVDDWKAVVGLVEEVEAAPKPKPIPETVPEPAPEPEDPGLTFEPEPEPEPEEEHEIEAVPEEAEPVLEPTPEVASDDDTIKISKDLVKALVNDLKALRSLIDRIPD